MKVTFSIPEIHLDKEEALRSVFENCLYYSTEYSKKFFSIEEIFEEYMRAIFRNIMLYLHCSYDGDGSEWEEFLYGQEFETDFLKILFEKTLPLWSDNFIYHSINKSFEIVADE